MGKISSIKAPAGVDVIYSLRTTHITQVTQVTQVTQARRCTAYRDSDFIFTHTYISSILGFCGSIYRGQQLCNL